MTVVGVAAPPTVIPAAPYRHSRVGGNPNGTEKTSPLPSRRWIPAYAGMTVGMGYPGQQQSKQPFRKNLPFCRRAAILALL